MSGDFQNVREFGAVGDGVTKDTMAIQAAIDAGGTVYFPKGTYLTGTLYLRDNGGLELAPDAKIVGSPDREDYNKVDFCPQNWASKAEKASGAHLIVALECENVFIKGQGTIHGNREAFFDPEVIPSRDKFTGWRPSQMLFFCESRNVTLEGVQLINSPYWSVFVFGCKDVVIHGIRLSNTPMSAWNGDGIDIDCSQNVTVSDCILRTGDDCITVRAAQVELLQNRKGFLTPQLYCWRQDSMGSPRGGHDAIGICENVVITNCVLQDGHCGVRFGVGTGLIRNCSVCNLAIRNCWYGVGIHSSYLAAEGEVNGVSVENIAIDNLAIDAGCPFYIASSGSTGPLQKSNGKYIRHLSMNNIRAIGFWNVFIQGNGDMDLSDVELNNINLVFTGGAEIIPEPYAERRRDWRCYRFPYGIFINNARDFRLSNVSVRWETVDAKWKSAVCIRHSEEIHFNNCSFEAPEGGAEIVRE